MIDFKELSKSGQEFELLIREILFAKGYDVYWSGVGPDGGKDLLCIEERKSFFETDRKKWLIQCKHNAHSEKSVGTKELDSIVDSCTQHDATGYILACSTQPSAGVVKRLEDVSQNSLNPITAIYWDYAFIEKTLSTTKLWCVAQRFFPISTEATTWKVYATETPSHWVVNYKGYYFHLANRIGSQVDFHFGSIQERIKEFEAINLPDKHELRPRFLYFDDKNGNYIWYLDYMYPANELPVYNTALLKYHLRDEYAFEDGQFYTFDIQIRSYSSYSDHFDIDHNDYYYPYMHLYLNGFEREIDWDVREQAVELDNRITTYLESIKSKAYDNLVKKFKEFDFIRLATSSNAYIEELEKFHFRRNWAELFEGLNLQSDRFLSAWFLFEVYDESKFHKLVSYIPNDFPNVFRLSKSYVYVPDGERRSLWDEEEDNIFELTLKVPPCVAYDKVMTREKLNEYFELVVKGLELFKEDNES